MSRIQYFKSTQQIATERELRGGAQVKQYRTDLLDGITLPPPPPPGQRIFQFFTQEAQHAVEQRAGPLYDLIVKMVLEMNPECFEDKSAVQILLDKMIWPPHSLEDFFGDIPHIPKIATHLRFDTDGDWIPVFEAEAERYLEISASRICYRKAFIDQFGNVDGFRRFMAEFVAKGGTTAQFYELIRSQSAKLENERLQSLRSRFFRLCRAAYSWFDTSEIATGADATMKP